MSDIAPTKTADVSAKEASGTESLAEQSVSVRVSPNSYFIALFLATFFSGLFIYLQLDWIGITLFGLAWLFLPFLVFTDRVIFDGRRLSRTGVIPNLWASINNTRKKLKVSDVEQVETEAIRALKRGGNVFYRYRTVFRGKSTSFAIASGGEDYRRMLQKILPRLSENVLDNRSIELRDYLSEPKETLMKAEFAHIPPADVLENSLNELHTRKKYARAARIDEMGQDETEKADYLRRLANELRLTGYLLQALEAFRRALILKPADGWLLFEVARCLQSFAGAERNQKLERKALAFMRLAEKRAEKDGPLLARLGESYFQFGEWRRAGGVFQKAMDAAGDSFRSVRGLAEIALREGKIAHVIHHFSTANRLAETPALRRWTQGEADYFSRLNNDDEYMELEVSRVNLLDKLERAKKTALRVAFLGFPAIFVGVVLEDDLVANIGWVVSTVSLLVWTGLIVSLKILSTRIPLELVEED